MFIRIALNLTIRDYNSWAKNANLWRKLNCNLFSITLSPDAVLILFKNVTLYRITDHWWLDQTVKKLIAFRSRKFIACHSNPSVLNNASFLWCTKKKKSCAGPHGIEIPYRAFPKRFGPRILSLESVDYFGTTDHFSGRKKKNLNEQNVQVYWKIRIEDRGVRDWGSVKKNLKIK